MTDCARGCTTLRHRTDCPDTDTCPGCLEEAGLLRAEGDCGACWHCHDKSGRPFHSPLIFLCPDCGDERCASALDHREECDNARVLTEQER